METSTLQEDFLALVEQNKGAIIKVCSLYTRRREEKDDLFQEIIIQLWKAWPNFKAQSKFSTWLYRIALNTAISGLRKKKTDFIYMSGDDLPHLPDNDDHQDKEEKLRALYEAIQQLSEIDRAVVLLHLAGHTFHFIQEPVFPVKINDESNGQKQVNPGKRVQQSGKFGKKVNDRQTISDNNDDQFHHQVALHFSYRAIGFFTEQKPEIFRTLFRFLLLPQFFQVVKLHMTWFA